MRHQPFQRHVTAPSTASPVSTHPKQGNPSKIHAHRVATWSAEPLLFGTFEPAKSKGGRVRQEALASSRHWLGGRNGPEQNRAASAIPKLSQPPASPVSTHPKQGNPSKIHAHRVATRSAEPLPFGTFEPPKSKGGRVKQGAIWQAAGIGWANVTAPSSTVRHQPFQRHVTAPSVTREHASETGKPQQDSRPPGCD